MAGLFRTDWSYKAPHDGAKYVGRDFADRRSAVCRARSAELRHLQGAEAGRPKERQVHVAGARPCAISGRLEQLIRREIYMHCTPTTLDLRQGAEVQTVGFAFLR